MARRAARILFAIITCLAALYLTDLVALSVRKNPTGSVTVRPYTVVPRNDKREELIFDDPRDQACVNSIFPHQQMPPCWYLRRHPEQRSNL